MILALFVWPVAAVFFIFGFWVQWMIVKTLRSIDEGIKDVARALREEP